MADFFMSIFHALLYVTYGFPIPIAVGAGLSTGLLLGLFQGLMVARFAIPAFIVTLAGSMIFKGIGYVWTNATAIGPIPQNLIWFSEGYIPPILSALLIGLTAAFGIWLTIRRGAKLSRSETGGFGTVRQVVIIADISGLWFCINLV